MRMWRSPSSPTLHQLLLTIPLDGRWSTSGSDRGNAHFFTATSNTIEGTGEKRTNEQTLGVNSSAERELCNTAFPVYICWLTLAWISSETSTQQLECRLILARSSFTGLDPLSCRLASLLRCPVSTPLRPPSPTPFSVPLSHSLAGVPSPLPVTSRSRVQNPLSGFAPKQTKESSAWWTTYIVLQG